MNSKVVGTGGTLSEELAPGLASQVKETAERVLGPGTTKQAAQAVENVGAGAEEGNRDTGVRLGGYDGQLRAALSGTSFAAPSLEPLIMALRDLGDAR